MSNSNGQIQFTVEEGEAFAGILDWTLHNTDVPEPQRTELSTLRDRLSDEF